LIFSSLNDIEAIDSMFLAYVVSRFFFFAFVLARRRFAIDLTIFGTIDLLISMFRVFLVEFEVVVLLALLAGNLISMNELHEFLREAIEMKGAMKSFESDILDEIVRCKVREEFRNLEFRRPMNSKSIIELARSSSRSSIDLVIIK